MTRQFFGTDGIRGRAGTKLTAELALKVGRALGFLFKNDAGHPLLIGKDPRRSGYMIEYALAAGATEAGMNVMLTGPIPTPGVAMLTQTMRAAVGAMISASHNQYDDNGIKLFGPDGYKLSDNYEERIEALVREFNPSNLATGKLIGMIERVEDERGRYLERVKLAVPKRVRLDGLRVVVDCANGAMYKVAPKVLRELGAEFIAIGVSPDGDNINYKCGSQHPEALIRAVKDHKAHVGIAFDGDGDRVVIVDENGVLADGDQILAVIAKDLLSKGHSLAGGVVGTDMTNGGLVHHFASKNIKLHRANVGDRFVLEQMHKHGSILGGEQSGHIIMGEATTGDGLAAALTVLCIIKESGKPASKVLQCFKRWPQKLESFKITNHHGDKLLDSSMVKEEIRALEQSLGKKGRLVVRKSGTEPVIRIMAEHPDQEKVDNAVRQLMDTFDELTDVD